MQNRPSPPSPWLRQRPGGQGRLRLFCLPYAGGGSAAYQSWARGLPQQIELCPLLLPGREQRLREAPFTDVQPLVQALAGALRPLLDQPYALFGHSMGALLAFELTRQLRREGAPLPVKLLASGAMPPQRPPVRPPIYALPEPEFIDGLRELGGTPEEVLQHAELMQLMMPMLRADFQLVETYRYVAEPPLELPIAALGGDADPNVPVEQLGGWREMSSGAFRRHSLPGGHFFIHSAGAQVLKIVANELAPYM